MTWTNSYDPTVGKDPEPVFDYTCVSCTEEFCKGGHGVMIDEFPFCVWCIKKRWHRQFLKQECGLDENEIRIAVRIRKPL